MEIWDLRIYCLLGLNILSLREGLVVPRVGWIDFLSVITLAGLKGSSKG